MYAPDSELACEIFEDVETIPRRSHEREELRNT
jgi:hypothetical protein